MTNEAAMEVATTAAEVETMTAFAAAEAEKASQTTSSAVKMASHINQGCSHSQLPKYNVRSRRGGLFSCCKGGNVQKQRKRSHQQLYKVSIAHHIVLIN